MPTSYTNVFGGTVIYPAEVSYRAFTLSANVTLAWPTELATNTNVVSSIMDVTPSGAGFVIRMPEANLASVGETTLIFNVGASSFTVADNSGNTIQTIASGQAWQIYLTDNTTVNGTWRSIQYGAGTSSPSASALAGAGLKAITTTLNQAAPTTLLSADYTLTSVDRARVLVWNGGAGTFTMPSAATAGNDWFFDARNSGTGGLTIAPTGGELINGQASLIFNPGDSARIITDGLNFYTIGYGQNATFSFDFVSISLTGQPSPYTLTGTDLNRIAYQFSGTLTANMQIIVPNTVQQYWIRNNTTGAYTLTVKTAAGTGVSVVQNGAAILYCDGTNVVEADTNNVSSPIAVSQGGTGSTTAGNALINLGGTSLGIGVFTAANPAVARASLGAAASGANADITSLSALSTPLSAGQGGTGFSSYTNGQLLIGNTTTGLLSRSTLTAGTGITVTNAPGSVTITATGPDTFPATGIAYSTGTAWGGSYGTSGTGTTLALTASPALTGTPTAPTAVAGTSTTQIATTAFVAATAFSPALPGQTGNAGKFVTTDGVNASWSFVPLASGVTGTLPVANGGTGASTLAANALLVGNGTGAVQTIAPGANGAALVSNGTAWLAQTLPSASVQEFSSSGTWTKPSGASFVLVEAWGAGGGGGRPTAGAANPPGSGGGGGGYNYKLFTASTLPPTVSVVIGAGGTGGSTNGGAGGNGGNTSFGSLLFVYGGRGGAGNATGTGYQTGGTGGGMSSATGFTISDAVSGSIITTQITGGGSGGGTFTSGATTLNQVNGSSSLYGGGGGAGVSTSVAAADGGGASLYGGGGGGSGGSSLAGGNSNNIPASIGGGSVPTTNAGAGAYFGACGGGQIPIYGIASPPAAGFLLGGGGGVPATTAPTTSVYGIATNGAQTVMMSRVFIQAAFYYPVLLVSANGLSTYTPYVVPKSNFTTYGIVHDGSKYVIMGISKYNSVYNSSFWYAVSTTDFITYTEYSLQGLPSNISPTSAIRNFFYLNGRYFFGATTGVYSSTDLNNWSLVLSTTNVKGIAFDGTYYYVTTNGTVFRSTDLSSWTSASSGAGITESIDASPSLVIVTSSSTNSRYSTDQGQTWSNLPTIPSAAGYAVKYISSTNSWMINSNSPANSMYYSTTPTTSWTQSASAVSASGTEVGYNGTYYLTCPTGSTTNAAYASTTLAGTFTAQTYSALPTAATPGSPGGIAGGGGGGAASSTTTTNGGAGGNGYCRVYSW